MLDAYRRDDPCYGYTKDDEGKPVIDEHEAVVVSRLFHLYVTERRGVPTIAKTLRARVRVQADCGGPLLDAAKRDLCRANEI